MKQLKQKFKEVMFKVNRKKMRKVIHDLLSVTLIEFPLIVNKEFFKNTLLKVFKMNKNKNKIKNNVTELELVMEMLSSVMCVDPEHHTDLMTNIEHGYVPTGQVR